MVGTILLSMELLKMVVMLWARADASCLRTKPGNLSWPGAALDLFREIDFWTDVEVSCWKWKLLAILQLGGTTGGTTWSVLNYRSKVLVKCLVEHWFGSFLTKILNSKGLRPEPCGKPLETDIHPFDTVPHQLLLTELLESGCSTEVLNWFCSYLTERQQRVITYEEIIGSKSSPPLAVNVALLM